MKYILLINSLIFSIIVVYYSLLAIFGLYYRLKKKPFKTLNSYPNVDVLIPAHNEGKVIKKTIESMTKLDYPGELNIYVLNDNSQDETGDIAEEFDKAYKNVHHIKVPPGEPKGKSRVLNYGLSISKGEYFVVYDGDNQPEPGSLKLLVDAAVSTPEAAGAVGYVRTINENKNILTRMISLEFQVFQLLMQCGRWFLFKTGSLTGTNMLVKRSVLDIVGKYDVYAIAEDAELTLRITSIGKLLPIVPEAVTWEQEPEQLGIFIKQRTRWLQGNLYILEKMFTSFDYYKGKMLVHTLQQILVYIIFLMFLLLSHGWFIAGLLGYSNSTASLPLLLIWYTSYIFYAIQLFGAQIAERTISPKNILISFITYFTYSQLFVFLYFRSLILYFKAKNKNQIISWDKTVRF